MRCLKPSKRTYCKPCWMWDDYRLWRSFHWSTQHPPRKIANFFSLEVSTITLKDNVSWRKKPRTTVEAPEQFGKSVCRQCILFNAPNAVENCQIQADPTILNDVVCLLLTIWYPGIGHPFLTVFCHCDLNLLLVIQPDHSEAGNITQKGCFWDRDSSCFGIF